MNTLIEKLPVFWQGVLASIIAAIIIGIVLKLASFFVSSVKESKQDKRRRMDELKEKVLSPDSVSRVEGYFLFLFRLLQYLFIANILWAISPVLQFEPFLFFLAIIGSLLFFYLGLRWIFILHRIIHKDSIFVKYSTRGSLHIEHAEYGALGKTFDVTAKLNQAIVDNKLAIMADNAISGDPIEGYGKQLIVTYTFDGETHQRIVPEHQKLTLP
jgi:hypothetical protein